MIKNTYTNSSLFDYFHASKYDHGHLYKYFPSKTHILRGLVFHQTSTNSIHLLNFTMFKNFIVVVGYQKYAKLFFELLVCNNADFKRVVHKI